MRLPITSCWSCSWRTSFRARTPKLWQIIYFKRFGSFAAVLDQPRERLLEVEGIGPQAVTFLLAIRSAMARYFEQGVEHSETISSPEDVANFVRVHIGANQRECLMALCLNDANRLLHHVTVIEGTVDRAPFLSARDTESGNSQQRNGADNGA